jgi:hypothetical protein
MLGSAGDSRRHAAVSDEELDREIARVAAAVEQRGPLTRDALAQAVEGSLWGPLRFRTALGRAVVEGRVIKLRGGTYGPLR